MLWTFAGFAVGTTITSVLRVNTTGCEQSPLLKSCVGRVRFADANTSAGAPSAIFAASAFEPPNEYFCDGSIFGNTSVSEAAA